MDKVMQIKSNVENLDLDPNYNSEFRPDRLLTFCRVIHHADGWGKNTHSHTEI